MVRTYHRGVLTRLAIVVLALMSVACARGAGQGGSTPSPTGAATHESPRVSPSLHIDLPPGKQTTLSGTFGVDPIEGGCAYLQADDRTRYEVIYPAGWQLDGGATQLRNPAGKVVATGGETITVVGQLADMASTCQIGPIFKASEVVTIDR